MIGLQLLKASSQGNRLSDCEICIQECFGECFWEEQLRWGKEIDTSNPKWPIGSQFQDEVTPTVTPAGSVPIWQQVH